MSKDLGRELKELIIESLDLEDVTPEDIDDDEPLFVDGLGLDSIDALELGMQIQKKYNLKLDANNEANKQHFASVNALRRFIESQQAT
ncbi:phosphopantetheine-binding protein [Halofilum ochraceum]|uniref:phosphopantetheine-binding protein n=1 Tax=Halofilum ochraceum TaxID=1611323 RepID=UPI0008333A21|nr:phosphopantetheine-binding protein [Halofilum ochraceum]